MSGRRRKFVGLARVLGSDELLTGREVCGVYGGDKWFARGLPEAVALPRDVGGVSRVLGYAWRYGVPVTARGAGYGYVGGCVPSRGGIVLSLERMDKILEVSVEDFVGVVEAGVVTGVFQDAVERRGLFYPPDPASRGECSLGGNVATNAGGPRCLKYGVTRDYVLGLEVVLAGGEVVRLGGRCHKNKVGFDLHRLFVGSEGLLGVVTEVTLKLLPLPRFRLCFSVGFGSLGEAAGVVRRIFGEGFLPAAVEVADGFTVAAGARRCGSGLFGGCGAHLIVELDGQRESVLAEGRLLERVLRGGGALFVRRGVGREGCERVWRVRREFSFGLRDTGLVKLNQDVVVPRGRLEDLFEFAGGLEGRFGVRVACFGHAGDGNIHVNVMVDWSDEGERRRSERAVDALFGQVLKWGGCVTGEHGVGLARLPWWEVSLPAGARRLHSVVKGALDGRGILNPGKFV